MNLLEKALPPISKEFAETLDKAFRPVTIYPGIDRDEIFQSYGERRVIDYIYKHSRQVTVSGAPEAIKPSDPFKDFDNKTV